MRQITFFNMPPAGPMLSSFSTPLIFASLLIVMPRIYLRPTVDRVPLLSYTSHLLATLPINQSMASLKS
jgi:hypothetical protein